MTKHENGRFGLGDHAFWVGGEEHEDTADEALGRLDGACIVLDMPRVCSLAHRRDVPIGVYVQRSMRDEVRAAATQSLVLIAVRHEDNTLYVGRPLFVDRPRPSSEGDEEPDEVMAGEFFFAGICAPMGIPWERGTLSVLALLGPHRSGPCKTEIGWEPGDYRDDAVESYVQERDRVPLGPPAPVWPPLPQIRGAIARALDGGPDPFPNFRRRDDSPALPDDIGIAWSVDRVADPGAGRCLLRIAFRLPLSRRERVPVDEEGRLVDVGCPGATAVVAVYVVGTGANFVGPFVLPLRLPTFDAVSDDTSTVTGYANIDLLSLSEFRTVPDTYFLTMLSRGVVTETKPVGVAPPRRS